jgi:hypothetical protein
MGGGLTAGQFLVQVNLTPKVACALGHVIQFAVLQADGRVVTDTGSAPLPPSSSPVVEAGQTAEIDGQWSDVCAPTLTFPDHTRARVVQNGPWTQGGPPPPRCIEGGTASDHLPSGSLGLWSVQIHTGLDGHGTKFRPPATPATVAYGSCSALIDHGWSGTCGAIESPSGRAAWVTEVDTQGGARAFLWRISADGAHASLALQWSEGSATAKAVPVDLGDGDIKVMFITRPVGNLHLMTIDVVEPDAVVVAHRDLAGGAVKTNPPLGVPIETWGQAEEATSVGPFEYDRIGYYNGIWQVISSEPSTPEQVPADAV